MMASDEPERDRKVSLLVVTSGLGIGGSEAVIRDLVRAIDRSRFTVSVCCLKALGEIGEELANDGFDVAALPPAERGRVDYLSFLKLRHVIRHKRIDVVHTHTTHALVDACLSKLTLPRLKVVHTFHFGNYPHRSRRGLWLEGVFSRLADRLIAVGEVQRQQIKSVYRLRDRGIGTVWNGVLPASSNGDRAFRARVGGEGRIVIGTIANLIEQKGLRDLIQVASRFRESRQVVRFVVVGEGHLRPELERLRRDLDLDDMVVFTGWLKNAATVVLPAVDIYFQPSLWEAMSIAILEAMAAGKPVVATRVGEAPYMIDDGTDGVLVEPGDVEGMSAAISRLIDDPGLRLGVGTAAARKVVEQFTIDRMTRAYESIYQGVLGWTAGC